MKKQLYIFVFVIFGILLQFLAHAMIETWYIGLLLRDFRKYGFGYSWDVWAMIHHIGTDVFLFAGIWFGYRQGIYWWPKLYDERGTVRWPRFWRI